MIKTSEDCDEDFEFAGEIAVRISHARDEFFTFMKSFDEDLPQLDDIDPDESDWSCLTHYFRRWIHAKLGWTWGYMMPERTKSHQIEYEPNYRGPGTREFEEFNRLLPHILLAVIDESLRFPELLDASPLNPDGSMRRRFRRSIPFIFQTKNNRLKRLRVSPEWDNHGDESLMYGLLFEPFPPIQKIDFD